MKNLKTLVVMMALALGMVSTQSAFAWCTPQILHCGDVVEGSTYHGHDDVSRYNCTGSTNWNGKADVYRISHPGDSLWIRLDWDSEYQIGLFVLTECNRNDCIAFDPHELNLDLPAGEYWIIVDARSDHGTPYELSIYCGDEQLAVELAGFTATSTETGVTLDWNTASETDNAAFHVERQLENTDNWQPVAVVAGNGTTAEAHSYRFTDVNVQAGATYAYRLLTEDINGAIEEMSLVVVTHSAPAAETAEDFHLIGNYPNPFNPTTTIAFDLADQSNVDLQVFDVNGRLVSTLVSGQLAAGRHDVSFDAAGLPSGVYFARLSGSFGQQMLKMVLMK